MPHSTKSAGTGIRVEFQESRLSLNAKKEYNDQYLWSKEKVDVMQKEVEELHRAKEKLTKDKTQEIEISKKAHKEP